MKTVLMNLKSKLSMKNSFKLCLWSGGWNNNKYFAFSLLYILLVFYNITTGILEEKEMVGVLLRSLPFIILPFLFFTKLKSISYFIADIFFLIILTIVAPMGTFSGVVFLYLILGKTIGKKGIYFTGFVLFLSVSINAIVYELSLSQIFLLIALFLFLILKFFYDIHLPNTELNKTIIDQSSTISDLKRKLSILGSPKGLSNEQILELYPFMSHTSDHPYRKIHDLILLTEGKVYKEIADINNIKNISTVSDQFAKMREAVGKVTNRDIPNNPSLIFVCVELNILKLNYRYVENI